MGAACHDVSTPSAPPAATKPADKKSAAVRPRHSLRPAPSVDAAIPRARPALLPSTRANGNRNHARMNYPARATHPLPVKPCRESATTRTRLHCVPAQDQSSRHQPQSMLRGPGHGRLGEWQRERFAAVPCRELVEIIGAERVTRFAHHNILRGTIQVAPVDRQPLAGASSPRT